VWYFVESYPFVFFLLAIALYVLRFMDSDYSFAIFNVIFMTVDFSIDKKKVSVVAAIV
jgi:hypothetical protein